MEMMKLVGLWSQPWLHCVGWKVKNEWIAEGKNTVVCKLRMFRKQWRWDREICHRHSQVPWINGKYAIWNLNGIEFQKRMAVGNSCTGSPSVWINNICPRKARKVDWSHRESYVVLWMNRSIMQVTEYNQRQWSEVYGLWIRQSRFTF